jgi:hypothetical protein
LSLLGIISVGASSFAPIMGSSIKKNENYNNLTVKKCNITGKTLSDNESCDQHNVSKYTVLELPASTQRVMYIDE